MNSEPCARLMTRMMPNTSVTPTAIRNSIRQNCTPLKCCSTRSASVMTARPYGGAGGIGPIRPLSPKFGSRLQCVELEQAEKGRDMSTSVVRRVGIIGLGKMGQPMARHLRKAGFELAAYDIGDAARRQAKRSGIALAANPGAVAEKSDFVIVVVGFDQEAETVLLGRDGITAEARPGLIVGIASTVAPRTM